MIGRERAFEATPRKMQLTSRRPSPPSQAQDGAEVEQRLTLTSEGGVWLSRYRVAHDGASKALAERARFSVSQEAAKAVLEAMGRYFSHVRQFERARGMGRWRLKLHSADGNVLRASGSLAPDDAGLAGLSDLIRARLQRNGLMLFDGNPDFISRIEIAYRRRLQAEQREPQPESAPTHWVLDCNESLVLDRAAETIALKRTIGAGCTISNVWHVQGGVASLLDDMDLDALSDVAGNPPDAMEDPNDRRDYAIHIYTKHGDERIVKGTYDLLGLPADWPEFIEGVCEFVSYYGLGDMFSESLYAKPLRRASDCIFCHVAFHDGDHTYSYLAEQDAYQEGDLVVVPVGRDNREAIARIESIEYLPADRAPYPMDKIKKILRKYEKTDGG